MKILGIGVDLISNKRIKHLILSSSSSVYGNKNGNWVDENSKTEPTSLRGIARLNAENNWLNYYKKFNLPVQIFRLSGIYSLENNIIKRLQKGTLQVVEKKNHFFSRIHVEDIAEVLTISLDKFKPGEIFNISDSFYHVNYVRFYSFPFLLVSLIKGILDFLVVAFITSIIVIIIKEYYKKIKLINVL